MKELIDALLELSKIARSSLSREPVSLSDFAQEILAGFQATEIGAGHPTEIVIQPNVQGNGDPRLLRALLTNLLGNAWKFSRKTTAARIEFGTEHKGGELVYFVRDNGAGFEMEYAAKLFGAFQRLHDPIEFEGTGIGLATCQRIVHRHGGKIWAEAKVDQGATFFFTLEPLS